MMKLAVMILLHLTVLEGEPLPALDPGLVWPWVQAQPWPWVQAQPWAGPASPGPGSMATLNGSLGPA